MENSSARFHESTFESATVFAAASGCARNLSAHTGALAPLRPRDSIAPSPSCRLCCRATSRPSKSQRRSLPRRRRLRLAADASAILLGGWKVFAWYILSPDMFRSEATDTRMGFRFSLNLRPNTLGWRFGHCLACAFVGPESEQNSSHPPACTAVTVERCIDCPVRGEARRSEAGRPRPGLSSSPASATTTIYASGTGRRTVLVHRRAQGALVVDHTTALADCPPLNLH